MLVHYLLSITFSLFFFVEVHASCLLLGRHFLHASPHPDQATTFHQTTREIEHLIDHTALQFPTDLKLVIKDEAEDAYFTREVEGPAIHIFQRLVSVVERQGKKFFYRFHPQKSQWVFAHELGHAILDTNLLKRFPFYRHVISFSTTPTPRNYDRSIPRYLELHIKGMHELFADVIAVLYNRNDPKTMFSAFHTTAATQKLNSWEKTPFRERDFSYRLNALEKWQESYFEHASLSPVRFFIYQNFLRQPLNLQVERQGKLVDALYQTIVDVIEYGAEKSENLMDLTPKEFSLLFIRILEENWS